MQAVQQGVRSAPWFPVATCGFAAATLFGAGAAAGLHGNLLLVTPVSLALLGCVLAVQRWGERYKLRASADAWIARGYVNARSRYAWRIEELTSRRERRALAVTLRRLVDEIGRGGHPGPLPLDRVALRPHSFALEAIATRLDDTSRCVSAAGVLAVHRLITDGATSPLYQPSSDVGSRLAEILDSLEVRS
jgi:hypothetical protein